MKNGFSEFEVKKSSVKFQKETDTKAEIVGCVGSAEEELDSRVVTKKCEGVVKKKKVFGTGAGKLKLSLHIQWDVYTRMFGLISDKLIEGVVGYGENSVHEEFGYACEAIDEDGNKKLKAYPRCVVETGIARKVENGADEVAEVELELGLMPDDNGFCLYEALLSDVVTENFEENWLTKFSPDLVKKAVG